MTNVVTFTKAEFEAALPRHNGSGEPLWVEAPAEDGEFVYIVKVDAEVGIQIRSSVKTSTGRSAPKGEESIRAWLVDLQTKRPLGKKVSRWTTRLAGWQDRLVNSPDSVIKTLWRWRKRAGDCPHCLDHLKVNKVQDNPQNQAKGTVGRPYASCWNSDCRNKQGTFRWLDEEMAEPPFFRPVKELVAEKKSGSNGKFGYITSAGPPPPVLVEPVGNGFNYGLLQPNIEQKLAIETPIDESVRIIAPAGAGKTRVLTYRYNWLLYHGVNPKNILAVTFNRTMADELYQRITTVNPAIIGTAAAQQICTIHAICKRLLQWSFEDKREVPPDWELKRAITEIAEELWPIIETRPNWSEILSWVNTAKAHGHTTRTDYQFFTDFCGPEHGPRLHECRRLFDEKMKKGGQKGGATGYITFPDMLLEIEDLLRRDRTFRERWQAQFGWVIIDEFQDTNFQALRILLTLSFKPGDNFIYDRWQPGRRSLVQPALSIE